MILPTKKQLKVLAFIKAHVAALLKKKLLKKRADGKLSVASTDPRSVN
jgi:hypothetical protein